MIGPIVAMKRAFAEFLTLPTLVIVGFLIMAMGSYLADSYSLSWLAPFRNFLKSHVFANPKATSDLLGAIAAGIIAVTSITITLLLIVAQQSAAAMTAQVFDQFLRRKVNQLYFGFFIGLALYSLITLATVNDPFNPIIGGTFAFILTVVALYLLVVLLYTTVDQMRPVQIIESIHDHILFAREQQLDLVRRTRRVSSFASTVEKHLKSEQHGYVTRINIDKIGAGLKGEGEVVLLVSIGSFVAFQDSIAILKTGNLQDLESFEKAVISAVSIELQRDIDYDVSYGIEQLETIGWTSISTSKSNPAPGLIVIRGLRGVLAQWSSPQRESIVEILPIVYTDEAPDKLLNAFETLAVVASESMQHQNFIEVLTTFTVMYDRLPAQWQQRVEEIILRILAVLGDLVLTTEMDKSLTDLADKLEQSSKQEIADAVRTAHEELRLSVGRLNSRATRVPSSNSI